MKTPNILIIIFLFLIIGLIVYFYYNYTYDNKNKIKYSFQTKNKFSQKNSDHKSISLSSIFDDLKCSSVTICSIVDDDSTTSSSESQDSKFENLSLENEKKK